jgi:hypothetical protein
MKKFLVSSFCLTFLFFLSSCGSIDKYSDSDFGGHKGYKQKIKKVIMNSAKNPDSVVIKEFSIPKKTLVQNTSLNAMWKPYYPAYGVCVRYKGTNSYGGYIETRQNFYLRNGEVAYDSIAAHNKSNGYDVTTLERYKPCNN